MSGPRTTSQSQKDLGKPVAMGHGSESAQELGTQEAIEHVKDIDSRPSKKASAMEDNMERTTPASPPSRRTTTIATTSQLPTDWKNPANPFSGGAEAFPTLSPIPAFPHAQQGNPEEQARVSPQLGNLHKRRASASPEKFSSGQFEPVPLHIETTGQHEPPKKRARLENKVEITYDSSGTPRVASITPTISMPSGRTFAATHLLNRLHFTPESGGKMRINFLEALCKHNDLLLLLVSYLSIPSLISLYAISRKFHMIFNRHPTAFILSCMRTWAPGADEIYPWRCYQSLCLKDPTTRQKAQWEDKIIPPKVEGQDLRDVPSLKWLQMVIWRQGVCKDMLIQLATQGLRCPKGTLNAIRRLWFIMDLPLNAHRIALCRSEEYITKQVVTLSTCFFLKVDMAFTNPAGPIFPTIAPGQRANYSAEWQGRGFVGCGLRELLLAERNFTPLWRVLRGMSWDPSEPNVPMSRLDVLRLWVRHKYHLPDNASDVVKKQSIMGIPWWEVGTASLERTGVSIFNVAGKQHVVINPGLMTSDNQQHADQQLLYPHRKRVLVPTQKAREPLLRPDQLMLREGIRRRMALHKQWVKYMLWGFSDDLGRNLPLRTEEELLRWSNGRPPMHPFKTDAEVIKEREEARLKKMAAEEEAKKKGTESGKIIEPSLVVTHTAATPSPAPAEEEAGC